MQLCTVPDEFIEEKPRWIANLSNGLAVYQDDDREGCAEPSAWRRLKAYVNSEKLSIVGLHIQFRSAILYSIIPADCEAVCFCHKVVQFLGGNNFKFFVIGYIKHKKIYRKTYRIPHLVVWDEDIKNEHEVPEDFIIRNYN